MNIQVRAVLIAGASAVALACGCNKQPDAQQPQQPQQPYGYGQPGAYPGGAAYPGATAQPGAYPGAYPGATAQPGAYPGAYPGATAQPGAYPGAYPGATGQPGYPAPGATGAPYGAPPAATGMPTAMPTALPTALPTGTPGGLDPIMGQAVKTALAGRASAEATGMKAEGDAFGGQIAEGAIFSQPLTMQPGRCYQVLAQGMGIQQLDIQITATMPAMIPGVAMPPVVLAQSGSTGPNASSSPPKNCVNTIAPIPVTATINLRATRGAGMAVAQVYSKATK